MSFLMRKLYLFFRPAIDHAEDLLTCLPGGVVMRKKFGPPCVADADDFNVCALGQLQISPLLHRIVDISFSVFALDGA